MSARVSVPTQSTGSYCLKRYIGATLLIALGACSGGGGGGGNSGGTDRYAVSVTVTGNGTIASADGSINCGTQCATAVVSGASLTLTAAAASGFNLQSWGGACTTATGNTCTVNVTQATNITASFVPEPPPNFSLTLTLAGNGTVTSAPQGINCTSSCAAAFAANTSVTLTAAPATGQNFGGWSGECNGTTPTCVVSMSVARAVTATFVAAPTAQTLSLTISGNGAVTSSPAGINCSASCASTFPTGTTVTLTATADSGWQFTGWSGACSGTGLTCVVAMTANSAVSANFTPAPAVGWSPGVAISSAGADQVRVAIDATGNGLVVWTQLDTASSNESLWYSRYSRTSGWSAAALLEDLTGTVSNPRIAIDKATGRAMVLWQQLTSPATNLTGIDLWARPWDPVTGWGNAIRVESNDGNVSTLGASAGMDATGNVIAVWSQDDQRVGRFNVWGNRYVAGSGWGTAALLEETNTAGGQDTGAIVVVESSGAAVTVWRQSDNTNLNLWTNRYLVGSGWATATELVRDAGVDQAIGAIDLALDGSGNAILVWAQNDFVGTGRDTTTWSKRFVSGAWQTSVTRVAPPVLTTQGFLGAPALALNAQGSALVAWPHENGLMRAAVATPGGPWATANTIRPVRARLPSLPPRVAIDEQSSAFATWVDRSDSGEYELVVSRYAVAGGWSDRVSLTTQADLIQEAQIAMNDRGHAILVSNEASNGTRIVARFYESGR